MIERDTAETLALDVLGWLVTQDELLSTFQGASGLGTSDLKERAGDPELLGAVMDFLLMDDAWVMSYCDAAKIPYERLAQARAHLPGGEQVHWT